MQLEQINSSAQHSLEPAPKDTSVSSQSSLEKKAKLKKFLIKRQQHQGHIINTANDSAVVTAVIITSTLTLFGTENNCSSSKSGMFPILGEGFQPFNLLGSPLLWFVFNCGPNILNG